MTEFNIKFAITMLLSGVVFYFMMRAQERREEAARRKFEQMMKARGLKTELEDEDGKDKE